MTRSSSSSPSASTTGCRSTDASTQPVRSWAKEPAGEVPEGYYTVPLGKAAIIRPGDDVTVLAYGTMVHVCTAAIEDSGYDAESLSTCARSFRSTSTPSSSP